MKKLIAMLLVLAMAASLVACSSSSDSSSAASDESSAATEESTTAEESADSTASADATHIYVLTASEDHGWTGSVATFAKEKAEEVNAEGKYTAEVITSAGCRADQEHRGYPR